jgi:putative membrane protein
MRKILYVTSIAGLVLFISLIVHEGVPEILSALAVIGWGLVWVAIMRIIPITLDAFGWSVLFRQENKPSIPVLIWARWIGESINTLLPVAQVGGNVVRAKLVIHHGVAKVKAVAIAVVDLTIGLAMQFIFAFMGGLLLLRQGKEENTVFALIVGLIAGFLILSAFYLTQRVGMFAFFARFLQALIRSKELISFVGSAKTLDLKIVEIYRNYRDVGLCGFWRLLSWITKTAETWLALYFLGFPVTIQEALILESLCSAVRISAFAIPGALGVQEGGILIIGGFIGISPEIALALALVKRVREILVGLPGLVSWSITESRRLS